MSNSRSKVSDMFSRKCKEIEQLRRLESGKNFHLPEIGGDWPCLRRSYCFLFLFFSWPRCGRDQAKPPNPRTSEPSVHGSRFCPCSIICGIGCWTNTPT